MKLNIIIKQERKEKMKLLRIGINTVLSISLLIIISVNGLSEPVQQRQNSQSPQKSSNYENSVILTIGNEKITYGNLEKAFNKNINKPDVTLHKMPFDSLANFIDLYTNYRLKVNDAISRGFDKDSAVLEEIKQNRRMLAESFFYERELILPQVNQMLKNRNREVQISIIVKTFPIDDGRGIDTLPTYKNAKAILNEILSGADFATVAKDSSDDPETSKNGGLVANFITSGNTQRPIDTVIFKLKPGTVYNDLIRISDGYLIIKVNKNEERIFVKPRHILLNEGLAEDSMRVVRKADSLIKLIKRGYDFGRLAEENSDDPSSAMRSGDIGGWYSRSSGFIASGRRLMPNFEEELYKLKDGEVSGIVSTDYGLHIILRDSSKSIDIELEKEDLKKLYRRVYYDLDKKAFLERMKKQMGFEIYYPVLNELLSKVDTTKTTLQQDWYKDITEDTKKKVLYRIGNKYVTVNEFLLDLITKREFRGAATNTSGFVNAIGKLSDPIAFDYATKDLEKKYPEFELLINEFRDGILLFKVAAIEVWDKLKFDSTTAYKFWEPRKNDYKTYVEYDITEVYVISDTIAKDIYRFAIEGTDLNSLAEQYTQRKDFREKKGEWGKISTKDNELAKKLAAINPREGKILEPIAYEDGFSVVRVNKIIPSRVKTFEEAISDFAPAYQEYMQKQFEEEWLNSIRKKFKVTFDKKKLDKIISDLRKNNR